MSIVNSCLLVRLNISAYSGTKTDKKLTRETIAAHGTTSDSLRVVKTLIDKQDMQGYLRAISESRIFFRDNTLPWDDEGWRILPSANHMEFMEKIRNMRDITQREYNAFVDNFPETMRKARIALNGTFCESDYPTLDALRAMFAFKIGCQQLPDSMSDFRIQLPKSEIEEIKRDWDNRISQAVENAQRDLYQRLAEPLSHLSAKLHDERGIFRDSIITNVLDICNIIPALNITKDRKLEDLRQVVMANLSGVRPDDLRHDKITRKKTAKKVDDICATLSDYFPQAKAA